jgi:hypothetical protein
MLNLGPHLGDDAVGAFLMRMEVAALWGLAHDAQNWPGPLNTAARSTLTYPISAQTEVSLPCSSASET